MTIVTPESEAALARAGGRSESGRTTPAGLQSRSLLTRRRIAFTALNLVTLALLTWGVARVFGEGGWSATDVIILVCFLFGAPWTVMDTKHEFLLH